MERLSKRGSQQKNLSASHLAFADPAMEQYLALAQPQANPNVPIVVVLQLHASAASNPAICRENVAGVRVERHDVRNPRDGEHRFQAIVSAQSTGS